MHSPNFKFSNENGQIINIEIEYVLLAKFKNTDIEFKSTAQSIHLW